jgi:hypothetical protein
LGDRLTVGRPALNRSIGVQIPVSQLEIMKNNFRILLVFGALVTVLLFVVKSKTEKPIRVGLKDSVEEEITQEYPKYGHAQDFSWVSGKLKYQPLEGGCWTILFSESPETADVYHGILAIENAKEHNLKDEGFVVLVGKVSGEKFSMACPPNLYSVKNVIQN